MQRTFEITISGQVQGVGFRPFVYGLAQRFQYNGSVCNYEYGVQIHLNCSEKKAKEFLNCILENAPKISIIQFHDLSEIPLIEYNDFKIITSDTNRQINIPLTPDFAVCESCKTEIRDKSNRRYGYAFTTCTNCGPRYAVTTKFPFERANTTIAEFEMCSACEAEYTNPNDRRFHSQTNSCADCGIQLKLQDSDGRLYNGTHSELVQKAANLIQNGNILALKNTNGYLLCCNANNKSSIERLRKKKLRLTKPFALLYPSLKKVREDFNISSAEENALVSSVAPIVILHPKKTISDLEQESIAPRLHQLGVMLPSSALLTLLMDELQMPIIATSGNIHGSSIISEEKDAIEKLSDVADYFLHHNLKVSFPQDDSVVRFANGHQISLRRSRGLAPNYLNTTLSENGKILAMGSHLKSTFSFVPNAHTYISQYFGNLDSYDVSERYQKSISKYEQLFDTKPEVILIDSHPQYQSSSIGRVLAEKSNVKLVSIQHHKAHFASVLGENDLFESKEKVLGVVWDGTGLGEDQAIWGGEFFNYENNKIKRLMHFEYVDWIAGDKLAKEPRLSLLGILPESEKEIVRSKFSETEWKIYHKMLNSSNLKTSSVGRLFDAVASLLDIIDKTSYEGEAAMLLENQAKGYEGVSFIDFLEGLDYENIPSKTIITNIQKAKTGGVSTPKIANSFIHTLALVILHIAKRNEYQVIACSGGVFQNAVLIEKLLKLTQNTGIELKINRILSSNDENISFGQLFYHQNIKN
jgi:hydrogenase maturation protein HypF